MRVKELISDEAPWLAVVEVLREEVVLGAFQRRKNALADATGRDVTRRASGGTAVLAGPGSLHVALALPSPGALTGVDATRIINRHVRPLLKALTSLGALGHYFGRDVATASRIPVAHVGFAHHGASGASLFEAIVAVTHPFALPPEMDGYLAKRSAPTVGNPPSTLAEVLGRDVAIDEVKAAIETAYDAAYGPLRRAAVGNETLRPTALDERAPFPSLVEEAIGFVGAIASPGDFAIGGDFWASEDLVDAMGVSLAGLAEDRSDVAIARALDAAFETTGGVVQGLRDLGALIRAARGAFDAVT